MRGSVHASGTVLAMLAMAISTTAPAQTQCDEIRAQYDHIEAIFQQPMTLTELQRLVSDMRVLRGTIDRLAAAADIGAIERAQWQEYDDAHVAIQALGARLGVACDPRDHPRVCAQNMSTIGEYALNMADPAKFEAWRLQDEIDAVRRAPTEDEVLTIAGRNGVACPFGQSCRSSVVNALTAKLNEIDAMRIIDFATNSASGIDPRRPFADLVGRQIVERLSAANCDDEPQLAATAVPPPGAPAPPPQPRAPATAPQPVPAGPAMLVLDPARPPQPSQPDANWIEVSPGKMVYEHPVLHGTWEWTPMPQSIPAEGYLVTLKVNARADGNNGWATGIQIRGANVDIRAPDGSTMNGDAPLNFSNGGSGNNSITVRIVPQNNAVGNDAFVTIGAIYGAQVRYYYRQVSRAAN